MPAGTGRVMAWLRGVGSMSVKAIAPTTNAMIVLVRMVRSIPKRKRCADTHTDDAPALLK